MTRLAKRRRSTALWVGILSVAVISGCSGGTTPASPTAATSPGTSVAPSAGQELFEMSIRADIYYTGGFMPFLVGIQQGIFEENGIALTPGEGQGSATTLQLAANRSDDVAFADGATTVRLVAEEAPLLVVAGILQKTPLSIGALPDTGIAEPADLEGKTGSYTAGAAAEVLFPAYALSTGIDADTVEFQQVDFATRDTLLLEGSVDFTFGFTNGNILTMVDRCECDLVVLKYSDAGMVALSTSLTVAEDFAAEHPEELRAFLAAAVEAYDYTANNLDSAIEDFFAASPESQLSPELVREQWEQSALLFHSDGTEGQPFGCTADADWDSTIELMEQYGGVTPDVVTSADIHTNEFLPGPCE